MKNLIQTVLLILSLQCFSKAHASFDLANGQYLSEQDLYLVLKSVFVKPGLLQDVDFELAYLSGSQFYELGFINLETGQPMTQAPGESYILYIDIFVNRSMNSIIQRNFGFHEQMFSKELVNYFTKKIDEYQKQTGKYILFYQYIELFNFSSLPPEMQTLFVNDLMTFVFQENTLVPDKLKTGLTNTLVPVMIAREFTMKAALITVIKKSIINDYFLKY